MPKTSVTNLTTNDVLQWNGTNWVNTTVLAGVTASTIIAGLPVYKTGVDTSRSMGQGNGDQVIAHGLGKKPKFVKVTAVYTLGTSPQFIWASGTYDGTNVAGIFITNIPTSGNSSSGSSTTKILTIYEDTGVPEGHTVTIAIDSTNITLTWAITVDQPESAANIIYVLWEASA